MRHRWPKEGIRPDAHTTFRACPKCGLVKVTRHEPDNNPPHWIEWERDGHRFNSPTTPPCEEAMKADTAKAAETPYRLVEVRASNFKILKAVAISVDGTMLKVSGKNEQGKSSLLDAVAAAIGGKDAFPKQPIRKGQDKAEIFLDFGGLKLTRKIWNKEDGGIGHSVTLEYADGKRPKSPQDVLDTLRGSPIADDPIAFARLKPAERFDLLKTLVPEFDFGVHQEAYDNLFDDRTQVGRDLKRAEGAAESIVVPLNAPKEPIDVTELGAQLSAAIDYNRQIDIRAERRETAADELEAMRDRIDKLAAEMKQLTAQIAEREAQLQSAEPLPEKIDTESINERIREASSLNEAAGKRQYKIARDAEAEALKTKYDTITSQLAIMEKGKNDAIAGAKLPIKGLTFGKDDILLDGLPFDQAATAHKIRVSTALLMALKPDLRVLLVREGSLLDDEARAALEADAAANNFVVLMECVGPGDGSGIVIENGEVL